MAATFFLLALNPSEQDILHREAVEALTADFTAAPLDACEIGRAHV